MDLFRESIVGTGFWNSGDAGYAFAVTSVRVYMPRGYFTGDHPSSQARQNGW